jgi:hypothetical protein
MRDRTVKPTLCIVTVTGKNTMVLLDSSTCYPLECRVFTSPGLGFWISILGFPDSGLSLAPVDKVRASLSALPNTYSCLASSRAKVRLSALTSTPGLALLISTPALGFGKRLGSSQAWRMLSQVLYNMMTTTNHGGSEPVIRVSEWGQVLGRHGGFEPRHQY